MTFLFLDRVAGIVGEPDALVSEVRARIFKEPVRHEGLRRLPRDEVRAHVASVVVRVANDRLRQPLMDAVDAHAREAAETHAMMHGDDAPVRDAVIEAFAGNDVGIDMTVFGDGEATPEAVADQVLGDVSKDAVLRVIERFNIPILQMEVIVDEILAPAQVEWSLAALADYVSRYAPDAAEEVVRHLFSNDPDLITTGVEILGHEDATLDEWLNERAMFSSPESDEADVAEVLRLINEKGGGSRSDVRPEADIEPAGTRASCVSAAKDVPAVVDVLIVPDDPQYRGHSLEMARARKVVTESGVVIKDVHALPDAAKSAAPVAAEPSDVTRAVTAALKTLFDMTKETDVHMAEVLGVPKAVVAQARKDVTPWSPDAPQLAKLYGLVGRYNDALAAAAGALGALQPQSFGETQ